MTDHNLALLFVFLLLSTSTIYATSINDEKLDCDNQPTTFDINQCALVSFEKSDKTLNDLYKHYQKRLEPQAKKALIEAQIRWIAFRDADCNFESSGTEGGNIQPMVYQNCRENRTQSRINQLKIWDTCKEGDLSCPAQ